MIPYKDDNPTVIIPYVTYGLIALNIVFFLFEYIAPSGSRNVVYSLGAMPVGLLTFESPQPVHPAVTLFSSMFLHGGLLHLGGNMLYLWIFGNNIEDRLGHVRFLLFYLAAGIVAAYSHALTDPGSVVPMVGASGAVSGVLGAYLVLYPKAKVYTLIVFIYFIQVVRLPALIVIGFWAIIQLINGIVSKGASAGGGVAWFAHIGGFAFGLLLIKFLLPKRRPLR